VTISPPEFVIKTSLILWLMLWFQQWRWKVTKRFRWLLRKRDGLALGVSLMRIRLMRGFIWRDWWSIWSPVPERRCWKTEWKEFICMNCLIRKVLEMEGIGGFCIRMVRQSMIRLISLLDGKDWWMWVSFCCWLFFRFVVD